VGQHGLLWLFVSYGVVAYATDIDRIRRFVGSADEEVLAASRLRLRTASLADLLDDYGSGAPSPEDVLAQLINGGPYDDRIGFAYAYALEALIETYGAMLDNSAWYPAPLEWAKAVEQQFERLGASVPVERLVWGGSPVPLPRADDFPTIGHLEAEEVRALDLAVRSLDLSTVEDANLRASIHGIRTWFDNATRLSYGLVCFYY